MSVHNPKNCQKAAKDIIQAAEFTCFGSLELIYDQYDRYKKVQAMRIYLQQHQPYLYIEIYIIAENSNCIAVLNKIDNKKQSYRFCKFMEPIVLIRQLRRTYRPYQQFLQHNNGTPYVHFLVTMMMISLVLLRMVMNLMLIVPTNFFLSSQQ